jgi:hypothetical protein
MKSIKIISFCTIFFTTITNIVAAPFNLCRSPLQDECMKCCATKLKSSNGIQREREMRKCLLDCGSEIEPFTEIDY